MVRLGRSLLYIRSHLSRTVCASSLIMGSAALFTSSSFAQNLPETAGNFSAIDASSTGVGDIVVTAQRRSENLQRVPLAITAITPERLQQLNLRDLPSLQQVTPGLQFNTGIAYAQVFIRGVGYPNTTPGVETSVATYIDGAYLERGFGSAFDVVDPATLQVLKGPQGTLWGRNATGGAILINTADPAFALGGRVQAEIGDIGHRLGEAVLNVPLSDVLAVRVAGRYREEGGYVRNLAGGEDLGWYKNWTVRGKILFEPSANFRAVAQVQVDRGKSSPGINAEYLPAQFCQLCSGASYPLPVTDPYTTVVNDLRDSGNDHSDFYNLRMTYDAGLLTLTNVAAYRKQDNRNAGDFDFTDVPAFNIVQRSGSSTFTEDLTLATNLDGRINGTAGMSYLHDKSYILLDVYSGNTNPRIPALDNSVYTESISAFGEVTAEIIHALKLTVGGRYTRDKRHTSAQKVSFEKFTPRAVLAYDAGPVNLYASWNRGYKAGGFSTPAANPLLVYKPETIESFEGGIKYISDDRRLRANLAVFHYTQKNLQVLAVNNGDIGNISTTQNAAAKGDGAEFEGDYKIIDALQLFGGLSYLRAKYTNFEGASVQLPTFDAEGNLISFAAGPEDLTGFRVPHAPRWQVFGGATITQSISDWKAELTGFVRYTSGFDFYPGGGGPLRSDKTPGYATVNLNGSLTPPNSPVRVGFYINNLTNKTYYDFRFTTAPFGGLQYVARPRNFAIQLEAKF